MKLLLEKKEQSAIIPLRFIPAFVGETAQQTKAGMERSEMTV